MIYEEHYKKYLEHRDTKQEINELQNKKISLLRMVDLQALSPKNGEGSNVKEDKMLFYASELEETETEIQNKKKILSELKEQLKEKESDLKQSDELLDKTYYYKYIKKYKWYQLCTALNFGKTRMYEITHELDENLSKNKRAEKSGKNL